MTNNQEIMFSSCHFNLRLKLDQNRLDSFMKENEIIKEFCIAPEIYLTDFYGFIQSTIKIPNMIDKNFIAPHPLSIGQNNIDYQLEYNEHPPLNVLHNTQHFPLDLLNNGIQYEIKLIGIRNDDEDNTIHIGIRQLDYSEDDLPITMEITTEDGNPIDFKQFHIYNDRIFGRIKVTQMADIYSGLATEKLQIAQEKLIVAKKELEEIFSKLFEILNSVGTITKGVSRLEKRSEFLGKYLIETMGSLKMPIPLIIETKQNEGIKQSIKAFFKGKEKEFYFVCAHCQKIHKAIMNEPGKFFLIAAKVIKASQFLGIFIPFISNITNILSQYSKEQKTLTDLLERLGDLNIEQVNLSQIKEATEDTKNEKGIITREEKERFTTQLKEFDMKICPHCLKYICNNHSEKEDCPELTIT